MNRDVIQQILGNEFIVKDIIEDEKELFAFYVSKEFEELADNDNYSLIGNGPFYFNKITQEKRRLGAMEFHEQFISKELFKTKLLGRDSTSLKEIILAIESKKHINGDEFESIMTEMNIDPLRVSISSEDFVHEIIESPQSEDIDKFKEIFEKANLEFVRESPNRIILKN